MKARFVGIQELNFQTDRGENVVGNNLFILHEDENVTGLKASKIFVKETVNLPKDLKMNDILDISFNMRGKVEAIHKE